jgi:beta-glucosidase
LVETLTRLATGYDSPPVYVHENGAAFDDRPDGDGFADDQDRLAYLREHVRAARTALGAGVDLRGFFVWSLLDNFEWAEGYSKRFGIVRIDYESQRRTPKASARWYSQVASGALSP